MRKVTVLEGENMKAHKNVIGLVLVCFLCLCVFTVVGCGNKPAPKPLPGAPGNVVMPARMIIGYYENPWTGTPDKTGSFPSMKTFANHMTGVAPFWYKATQEGNLEGRDSQIVYDTAHQAGLKMYPLITNKSDATDMILGDSGIRSKVVDNIVKLAKEKKYDGVNIDFELLPPKHRDNLTAFMAELYPKLKAINKTLIISVFPQVEVTPDVSGAYNYPELAKNADFLQIMTYDNHWATSKPGPIAPIAWYEKNIKYAIDQCGGAHKVIVGVGAYGYDWPAQGDAETITYADSIVRAEKKGTQVLYDQTAQAPYFKYTGHEVWFENVKSTEAKIDVINKYNPAGIAIWRLGQEQPEIWSLIEKKYPKK